MSAEMSGVDRETRLKELAEQLGVDWLDYYVYAMGDGPWVARFEVIKIKGEGESIAQAEYDLIEKLEKYIDEGGLAKDD